jgi:hypothetical protein
MTKPLNTKSFLQENTLPVLNLAVISAITIFLIGRDLPYVGFDHDYFMPRMLDAYLHQKINGFQIQWYTPSFGGGLPAYPNPQDIQHSLPQLLMLVFNPWLSLMLSLFFYSSVGYIAFYLLLKNEYGFEKKASTLGAGLILANGFYIEHAVVGHVNFQQFPLLGVILYLMFSRKTKSLLAGVLLGMTIALIINQAGFYILFIFILSLVLILPMTGLLAPQVINWRRLLITSLTGVFLALLLSASKLSAVYSFMRFFPREAGDFYQKTYVQGVLGFAAQMAGCGLAIPYYLLTGKDLAEISRFLQQTTGSIYGIWESDISISPAVFLLIVFGIVMALKSLPEMTWSKFSWRKFTAFVFLLFGIWLATDFTLAQGVLYNLIKPLPVIKSLHVNVRFAAAFIFPLSLLGAYIFDIFIKSNRRMSQAAFIILNLLTVSFLSFYLLVPAREQHRSFNINASMKVYSKIDKGEQFPIQKIATVNDKDVFLKNASNIGELSEPLFGYKLEHFNPGVQTGSIFAVEAGYYNMTNPASYVFPKENNLQLFERFRVDQKESLKLFANHRQTAFNISTGQKIADILSMATLIALCLYFVLIMARNVLFPISKQFNINAINNDMDFKD